MLDLHKQLPKAKTPHEQESLKRTIEATDARISRPASTSCDGSHKPQAPGRKLFGRS